MFEEFLRFLSNSLIFFIMHLVACVVFVKSVRDYWKKGKGLTYAVGISFLKAAGIIAATIVGFVVLFFIGEIILLIFIIGIALIVGAIILS